MDFTTARIAPVGRLLDSPPQTVDRTGVVMSAVLLTGLLVAVVPLIALSTGISLLVWVGLAGVVYAVVLVLTNNVFEGLCAAVFVLCPFLANVPLLTVPFGGSFVPTLSIMFVDVVAVPLAILFVVWGVWDVPPLERRAETVAGYALAGLAVWAALAAVFGHGPSQSAALFFAVDQFRYLLLFVLGATIVRYTGIQTAAYSLLIAVIGNMAFAVAEVLNRGSFGLTYLGDTSGSVIGLFAIGPLTFQTSTYAGGFTGTSRLLIALVLLTIPLVGVALVRGSNWQKVLAAVCLLGAVFLTRVTNSDAAFAALLLTVILMLASLLYVHRTTDDSSESETTSYSLGYLGTIGTGVLVSFLFSKRTIGRARADGGQSGGASGGGGAGDNETTLTETVLSVVNQVPFIDTTSLPIRIQEYVIAVVIGLQYPLFGLGGSNFKMVAESYGLPRPVTIHNTFLAYLAATGVPGAVFFLVAVVAVLVVAIKNVTTSDHHERLFWAMIVCGMLGFHAITFWSSAYRFATAYMPFWVLAGAVVGSRYWTRRQREQTSA